MMMMMVMMMMMIMIMMTVMMMMMMSHTTLSHTALSHNLSSTISFTFAAFPLPSSWLFFAFGRSWHVGLSGPISDGDDDDVDVCVFYLPGLSR